MEEDSARAGACGCTNRPTTHLCVAAAVGGIRVADGRSDLADTVCGTARVALGFFAIGTALLWVERHIARDVHACLLALNRLKVSVVCLNGCTAAAAEEAHDE